MTNDQFFLETTPEQKKAMYELRLRSGISWADFLERCTPPSGPVFSYVGVNGFHGMFVGIESDGYTHS